MKRVLFMLAGVLMFTAVSAQENSQRRERRQQVDRTEQMVKDFKLNAEQSEKLKALNEKYNDLFGMRGFGRRGQGGGQGGGQMQMPSREEMEKMMKERQEKMEAYNNELKEILTADQFEAYQKQQEERRRNRPQFGGGGGFPGGGGGFPGGGAPQGGGFGGGGFAM